MNKKGIFFSIDSLLALVIILLGVLIIYPIVRAPQHDTELEGDFIGILSSLKMGEIDNPYAEELRNEGEITDINKSVLEQIGEFYITNRTLAKNLAQSILNALNISENIGLWYGNTLLASKNSSSLEEAKNIYTERQIISGIKEGDSVAGFSAKAYLTVDKLQKYFYFGGYVGEGNLSVRIEYTGAINEAEMELAINSDFDVYINGVYSGSFTAPANDFEPKKYNLSVNNFQSGINTIEIRGDYLHISGGYVKITYEEDVIYAQPTKHYLPGIDGIINLYDGFYVPGQLNKLKAYLHFNSNYSIFLTIGNQTIFTGAPSESEQEVILTDSHFASLNYTDISEKTIPIRIGLTNVSYMAIKNTDAFSVVDLSGSINQNIPGSEKKIKDLMQEANEAFILALLSIPGNRAGLVGYKRDAEDETQNHDLSSDFNSLNSTMDEWKGGEGSCVCCGILKARDKMLEQSNENRFQALTVMSDGKPTEICSELGAVPDLDGDGTANTAKDHAVQAACLANESGILIHVVGFGPGTTIEEATLQAMADCGEGEYYASNYSILMDIYREIAYELMEAAYEKQTILVSGDVRTILYPDSYIEFNYSTAPLTRGLVFTIEKNFNDEYSGSFSIPDDSEIVDTTLVSYSGPRWTDSVVINSNPVYQLAAYGLNFTELGDPYSINIPNSLIQVNNEIYLTTGTSSEDSGPGSKYNKIIYTLVQESSAYSSIVSYADGCIWHFQFEDGETSIKTIPQNYEGTDNCYYEESQQVIENEQDAMQVAVFNLIKLLDFNSNGKLDVKLTEQNLEVEAFHITGVPYDWSTEIQVRRWY